MQMLAAIRIDASNPLGAIIIAIILVAAAVGLVYAVLDFLVGKIILPLMGVPEDKREAHALSKAVWVIILLLALFGVVSVILPAFGVDTGPVSILNLMDL